MGALIAFIVSIIIISIVWKKEASRYYMATPLLLILLYMLLRVFPGFTYSYYMGIYKSWTIYFIYIIALLGLLFGFFLTNLLINGRTNLYSKFHDVGYSIQTKNHKNFFFSLNIFCFLLIISGIYLYQGLPYYLKNFQNIVSGSVGSMGMDFSSYRKVVTKGHYFGGEYRGQGIIRSLQLLGWSVGICGYYSLFKFVDLRKYKKKYKIFFILSIIIAFFFVTGDGTRSALLLTFLCLIALISLSKKISKKFIIRSGVLLISVLFTISLFNNKLNITEFSGKVILEGLTDLFERISLGNSINDVYTIELVHEGKLNFKYGGNIWQEFVNALPGVQGDKPFANELYVLMSGNRGGTTYATGTNIMRGFIDGGIIGVFFSFMLCGIIVSRFSKMFSLKNKDLLNFSMYAVFVVNLAEVYTVGVMGVLVKIFVLIIILQFLRFLLKIKSVYL